MLYLTLGGGGGLSHLLEGMKPNDVCAQAAWGGRAGGGGEGAGSSSSAPGAEDGESPLWPLSPTKHRPPGDRGHELCTPLYPAEMQPAHSESP